MRIIEALRKGFHQEQSLTSFERARKTMEEAGGKKLLIGIATEIREKEDPSSLVNEDILRWSPSINTLTLRWDLKKMPYLASSRWSSKGVRISASRNGKVAVELTSSHGWTDTEALKKNYASFYGRRVEELFPQKEESLEEKVRFAMERADHNADFRYGEGEESLKQKPVKSRISKRIF